MRRSILVNLVVLLCISVVTSGATRLVPSEYSTIQGAIDAANDGDTVIVAPGTYYENINLKGKDVVLRSKDPHNPHIVAATVIDGNEKGTVVTFDSGEDANCVLDGFTVAHGRGSEVLGAFHRGRYPL